MEKKHVKRYLFVIQLIIFMIHFVSSYHIDGVTVTQSDHQALIAIRHELIDSNQVLSSWNNNNITSNGACSGGWAGIKCVQGHVIAIQLPWKGLSGRISEKIGLLKSLRKVSLHDNALTGPIPTSLGFIPHLRGVYLFNNRFSGSIPPSIGNCLLLQTLDVSNNLLIGKVPSSLVNSENVYRLNLSFNSLSGSIPVKFTQSNSLQFLDLQHNNLSGSVPDSWDNSYQLQLLTLNHNLLTGTFHIGFSNLSSLETLNLNHNKFTGQIPDITNQISNISHLDLSENGFTGEISDSFSNLKNLKYFNVSYNNLSGPVPQLLTKKFNSSSFIGNLQLCGYINSSPCPSVNLTTSPFSTPNHHKRKLSTKDIILIASGILLLMLLLICCLLLCCLIRKRTASKQSNPGDRKTVVPTSATRAADIESGGDTGGRLVHFDGPFMFTADDLLCATAEIMGKSAYGTAYKATLEDGDHVAVKRLREKTTKGQKEFEVEVSALGKIRHPNISALRAYYLGPKGEKLLVFDYMTRGSLASFLHARGPETAINWTTRMNIATGITRGLHYLHKQEDIIHGNLTSSNILLDEQSNPHIADVGLSKLMTPSANTNMIATSGSTRYRAPELSKLKKANEKSDVYSLGVIILELLTGKSPSEGMNGVDLPQWVASIVKEEWTNEVFDLELMKYGDESGSNDELLNTLRLALHCVDPSPEARPDVQQVMQQLEEIKMDLTEDKTTAGEA